MDEIKANRLISTVAVLILIITALFIFSVSRVEVSVSISKSGWVVASSGGNTSASLSHSNCTYEISNDPSTNSTTIAGIIQESFTASQGSSNLTYGMGFFFWFPFIPHNFIIDVYMNATLFSWVPVDIYYFSFSENLPFTGLSLSPLNDTWSFNNPSLEKYIFVMDWAATINFINSSLSDAEFFCNVSFSYMFPDQIAVNLPSSLGYTSLVGAVVGVAVVSMVFRAWNRPRLVDDSF